MFLREHRLWYIIIPHTDNNLHLTEEEVFPFDNFHLQKLLIPVIKATLVARHKSSQNTPGETTAGEGSLSYTY